MVKKRAARGGAQPRETDRGFDAKFRNFTLATVRDAKFNRKHRRVVKLYGK